jgi:hypothetical protein
MIHATVVAEMVLKSNQTLQNKAHACTVQYMLQYKLEQRKEI